MNQRAHNRISTKQPAKFLRGKILCSATVINVSKSGMRVNAPMLFPLSSKFEMHLATKAKDVTVHVKVARLIKKGDSYDGMGVELSKKSEEYLEYINMLSIAK